jgi:flagellar assembly factor FliW
MNTMELTVPETDVPVTERTIEIPLGLLGFESSKKYALLFSPEEEPFMWLQMRGSPNFAFLVVSPFCILPDYHPDLGPGDVDFLNLSDPSEACILNIVTLHDDGRATMNLKGPIVINRQSWIGKQVILANASSYSLQHPLPLPA